MRKIVSWMERHEWFLIILAAGVLLRIPSLFEPYWYGDEGIYLAIGQAMRKGVMLYSQIHDNKPPFLYLMAAISNGQIFWFKFWAGIFNLLTIGAFYKLATKLDKKKAVIATWVFALLTTLPILEGNIANAENFFLLFTVSAFYILWTSKNIFLGGLILGLGALFKMPPIVEAGIWPIFWLFTRDKHWFKKSVVLVMGVLLPIFISIFYYWMMGAGKEYFVAAWAQNLPYLTSWKATSTASGIYSLKNRVLILILGTAVVWVMRKRWQKTTIILALWTLFTWFASLLSGRPYPHYLLQMAPVMALWSLSRTKLVLGWTGLVITWSLFQFYVYPVFGYYKNFTDLVTSKKSIEEYRNNFNTQVDTNYKLAEKVRLLTEENDKIFVWGDEPMVYSISRRLPVGKYLVRYHILDFDAKQKTMTELIKDPAKLVLSTNDMADFSEFSAFVRQNYYSIGKIGNTEIWKLTEPE